jgi:hypothetical protein
MRSNMNMIQEGQRNDELLNANLSKSVTNCT